MSPLFHKKDNDRQDGFAIQSSRSGPGSDPEAVSSADPVASATEHFSGLSVPQRAAEILEQVTGSLEQQPLDMEQILGAWLPRVDWMTASDELARDWQALAQILQEALGALVLSRLVIRQEQDYRGATRVTYVNSPDGRAALTGSDVADVIGRRLPD